MNLVEKDARHVWHPFTQVLTSPQPLPIVSAKDSWLLAEDGKKYLDANSSWWTVLHGHAHPHVNAAVKTQIDQLDHVVFAGTTHPKAVETAERITSLLGDGFDRVFFSDNGSTANEVALKMVVQYWFNQGKAEKKRFVALEGAYHGDTFGAMSVGERDLFNKPFESLFFDVTYLPFPTAENEKEVLEMAEQVFSDPTTAGFIFEPLCQGASGMRMYSAELLDILLGIARKNGLFSIADEVMTGFYRTGKAFAIHHLSETVDIVCLSKGLTGGILPMGLTVTSDKLYDSFLHKEVAKGFLHGHSFTGNPIICAAICASLDLLEKKDTQEKIKLICELQTEFLEKYGNHPNFRNVRQLGTILAVELEVSGMSSYFSSIRNDAYDYFIENGILLRPLGNVVFINPPYCFTKEQLIKVQNSIVNFAEEWFDQRQ